MRIRFKPLLKPAILCGLMIAAVVGFRSYFKTTMSGTTASVANRMMWQGLGLPASASDVTYYADSGGCEAEFAIPVAEFLELCEQRGWEVSEIETPVAYFEPVLLPDDERLVREGYTFWLPDGRGVYDSQRSRAAFYASTFP